jgi:hypothetical protein
MTSRADPTTETGRRGILALYILIAYAVSWGIEIPLALKTLGVIKADVPFSLHYLAAFGPFIAGIVVTWLASGREGWNRLLRRMVMWRVGLLWWLVAVSPLLIFIAVDFGMSFREGGSPGLRALTRFDFIPDLGIGAVVLSDS